MHIDLTDDEVKLVTTLLDSAYQDLRAEIYKTEAPGMRDDLKREESTLRQVLAKLGVTKP